MTFYDFMLQVKVNKVIYMVPCLSRVKPLPKSLYIKSPHGSTTSQRSMGRLFGYLWKLPNTVIHSIKG